MTTIYDISLLLLFVCIGIAFAYILCTQHEKAVYIAFILGIILMVGMFGIIWCEQMHEPPRQLQPIHVYHENGVYMGSDVLGGGMAAYHQCVAENGYCVETGLGTGEYRPKRL
jgi:hypothetical protein